MAAVVEPRYRLQASDGEVWYCTTCQADDNWRAVLPEAARFPTAYTCGCGQATIGAGKVTARIAVDPDAAGLFEALDEWFAGRIAELEWLHCRGAWREARALSRWLEGA